jgi:hypothetical protein
MRTVTIVLSPDDHACLMDHVSTAAPAYKALEAAIHLGAAVNVTDQYVVTCDEADAESLLAAAERDCQTAAEAITIALRDARRRPR